MLPRGGVEKNFDLPLARPMDSNGVHKRFHNNISKSSMTVSNRSDYNHRDSFRKDLDNLMEEGVVKKKCKQKIRFIKKSGRCNVSHANLNDRSRRFLADIFTTGVDLQWRWNLFVFSAAFVLSWLFFGLLFWLFSFLHGDFNPPTSGNSTFTPCIKELDLERPFTSTFLFSLETQTTIGYGYRHVTEECWLTILVVVLQSVFGCILDAFMIGLIMAKISRPKKRAETLLFSRNAVINLRDGRLCLMARVGNLRKSHLVEATIRMQFVYSRETAEGEYIPIEQVDLNLDIKNDSDRLFLVTPQTICHPIDEDSPLWDLSPQHLETSDFEVIVILEGMVEATGMTTQARASYLPSEILWGSRFHNMISLSRSNAYKVNFKKFHDTYATNDAPQCSAKELHEASIRPRSDPVISLRTRRPSTKSGSESSSTRSSTVSQRPLIGAEETGGVFGAFESLPRSDSKGSINKAMTSTTSLSEDCESSRKRSSMKSSSSSLIDLSSPKPEEEEDDLQLVSAEWEDAEEELSSRSSSPAIQNEDKQNLLTIDCVDSNPSSNTRAECGSDNNGFATHPADKPVHA